MRSYCKDLVEVSECVFFMQQYEYEIAPKVESSGAGTTHVIGETTLIMVTVSRLTDKYSFDH